MENKEIKNKEEETPEQKKMSEDLKKMFADKVIKPETKLPNEEYLIEQMKKSSEPKGEA